MNCLAIIEEITAYGYLIRMAIIPKLPYVIWQISHLGQYENNL